MKIELIIESYTNGFKILDKTTNQEYLAGSVKTLNKIIEKLVVGHD